MPVTAVPTGELTVRWNVFPAASPKCMACNRVLQEYRQTRYDGAGVTRCKSDGGRCKQPLLVIITKGIAIVAELTPEQYHGMREREDLRAADALEEIGVLDVLQRGGD